MNPVLRNILVVALSGVCIYLYMYLIGAGMSRATSALSAAGLLAVMVVVTYVVNTKNK